MTDQNKKDWKKFKNKFEFQDNDEPLLEEDDEAEGEGTHIVNEANSQLSHSNYIELEEKLTLAEQQVHENWEKAARAVAELDNVRRRAEKDIANAHRYALEKFVTGLLPVIDSLEQALQLADKENQSAMYEGLDLTMKLLLSAMEKQGVIQLDPMGEAFNPEEHEAMAMQEFPDLKPNTVANVFQKGYKLSERVIRPARVIVAKALENININPISK